MWRIIVCFGGIMFFKYGMQWICELLLYRRNIIIIIIIKVIICFVRWSAELKSLKPLLLLASSSISVGFIIDGAIQPQDSYLLYGSNHTIKCKVYTTSSSSFNISMPTLRGYADVILEDNCSTVEPISAFGRTSIRRRGDDDNDDDNDEERAWRCREVVYKVVNITRSLDSVHVCQVYYAGKIQVVGAATIRVGDKPMTIRDLMILTSIQPKAFYAFYCTENALDRCFMEIGKRRHHERNSIHDGNISCRYFRYGDNDDDDDDEDNGDGDDDNGDGENGDGDRDGDKNGGGSELNATVTCRNIFSEEPSVNSITLRHKAPIRNLSYIPLRDGVVTLNFQGPEGWDYRLMPLLFCVYKDERPIGNFCLNEQQTYSFNREIYLDDVPDSSNVTLCFRLLLNDPSTPGDARERKSTCQGGCRQGYGRIEAGSCEILSIRKDSSPPITIILLLCIFIIPLTIAFSLFVLKFLISPFFPQKNLSIHVSQSKEDNYSTINPYESSDNIEKQYIRSLHPNIRSERTGDKDGLRLLQGFSCDQSFVPAAAAAIISEATSSATHVAVVATTPTSAVNMSARIIGLFSDIGYRRGTSFSTKRTNIPEDINPQLAEFQSSTRFKSKLEIRNEKFNFSGEGADWADSTIEKYPASYATAQLTEPTWGLHPFTTRAKSLTFLETIT